MCMLRILCRTSFVFIQVLLFVLFFSTVAFGEQSFSQQKMFEMQLNKALVGSKISGLDSSGLLLELDQKTEQQNKIIVNSILAGIHRRVEPEVQEEVLRRFQEKLPDIKLPGVFGTKTANELCTAAVKATAKAEKEQEYAYRYGSDEELASKTKALVTAIMNYDKNCLALVPELGVLGMEAGAYEIVGIIGAANSTLGKGIREVWCVATYIGNSSIITAKHCLYGPEDEYDLRREKVVSGDVFFQRISAPKEIYHVGFIDDSALSGGGEVDFKDDALLLSVDNALPTSVRPSFDYSAKPGMPLLVMGYVEHSGQTNGEADAWVASMRKGAVGLCMVETVAENCVVHTCTTEPRFSGAPMIALKTDSDTGKEQLAVVGLHVAAAGETGCSSSLALTQRLNVGLASSRIKAIYGRLKNNVRVSMHKN